MEWFAAVIPALLLLTWLATPPGNYGQRRRRLGAARQVAAEYRRNRHPPGAGGSSVTVAELVERAAREQGREDEPTDVLPRAVDVRVAPPWHGDH